MTPIGDIDVSVEDGECAALVLIASVETLAARCERFGDIDRPARQGRAVLQRQGKNSVMRTRRLPDHRGDIDRLGRLVDDRRTGNAERVDIAAIQRRERHGPAQRAHPDFMARARIDRVDIVVLGGDEELPRRRSRRPPIERLGIEVARDQRMKARVETDVAGAVPGQRGYGEIAAPVGTAVVGQHGLCMRRCGDPDPQQQGAEPPETACSSERAHAASLDPRPTR